MIAVWWEPSTRGSVVLAVVKQIEHKWTYEPPGQPAEGQVLIRQVQGWAG